MFVPKKYGTVFDQHFGCDEERKLSSRKLTWQWNFLHLLSNYNLYMAVCQNLVPLVNIKIAGKWMFIPLKMVLIGIDPYPYIFPNVWLDEKFGSRTASNPKRFQTKTCRAAISSHIQRQLRGLVFLHQQPAEWGYGNAVILVRKC